MKNKDNVNLNEFYTGNAPKKKKRSFKTWWKKRKKWQKTVFISVLSLFLAAVFFIVSYGVYFLSLLNKIQRDDEFPSDNKALGFTEVIDENVVNIALFGVDTRIVGDFSGKSDSIMILSINKTHNKIRLVSVMRDSLVPYDNNGRKGTTKITELYALGGPELAVRTLNTVFGLDISEYATVNFYGMADIIDEVGGIDVELTFDEVDPNNAKNINDLIGEQCDYKGLDPTNYFVYETGKKHLNGIQAVAYSRIRYGRNIWGSNNDFGRTERQRYVMQELFKKALDMNVTSYSGLVEKLAPHVKTSLSNSEMLSLANYLIKKPSMEVSRVPSDGYIINADYRGTGASTVYYNYKFAGTVLRAFLYDGIIPEDYMEKNGVDKTPWHDAPIISNPDSSDEDSSSSDEGSSESGDSSSSDGNSSDGNTSDGNISDGSTSADGGGSNSSDSGSTDIPTTPEESTPQTPDGGETTQ